MDPEALHHPNLHKNLKNLLPYNTNNHQTSTLQRHRPGRFISPWEVMVPNRCVHPLHPHQPQTRPNQRTPGRGTGRWRRETYCPLRVLRPPRDNQNQWILKGRPLRVLPWRGVCCPLRVVHFLLTHPPNLPQLTLPQPNLELTNPTQRCPHLTQPM